MVPNSEVLIGKDAARSLLDDNDIEIINIATDEIQINGSDKEYSQQTMKVILLEFSPLPFPFSLSRQASMNASSQQKMKIFLPFFPYSLFPVKEFPIF